MNLGSKQGALMIATAVAAGFGLVAASFDAPMPLVTVANAAAVAAAVGALTARSSSDDSATDTIAEVSHELRTPLTGILGTLELLTESTIPLEPSEVDELLVAAHSDANHLLHVVSNLHARSRLDRAILTPDALPTNLREAVSRAIGRSPQVARRSSIMAGDDVMALGDAALIMQIVTNLVQNIERYAKQGDVRVTFFRRHDFLNVSFADDGPGVPNHRAEQIFDVSASSEGLGLGLSLSRQLARAMGGDLTCDNPGETGAVFTLRLPASDEPAPEAADVGFDPEERHQAHSPRARLLVDLADALNGPSLTRVVSGITKIYQELLGATGTTLVVPRKDGSFHSTCCHERHSEIAPDSAGDFRQVLDSGTTTCIDDMAAAPWGSAPRLGGNAALLLPVHDGEQVVAVLAAVWKSSEALPTGSPRKVAEALAQMTASAIARTGLTHDVVYERRLRASVMNELPIAVSIFAGDPPEVIDWNSKERELLGMEDDSSRPHELAASQDLFRVRFSDGTPLDVENSPVTQAIRTGKATGPFILVIQRTDGSQVHTRTYCAPFFDADGDVAGAVVTSEALDLDMSR